MRYNGVMIKHKRSVAGFTLIELLLAMTFFSFVLVLISTGFIQISRIYQNAVISKTAQNTVRQIVERISRDAYAGDTFFVVEDSAEYPNALCFGVGSSGRYYWDKIGFTLKRSVVNSCDEARDNGDLVHESLLAVYDVSAVPVYPTAASTNQSALSLELTIGRANISGTDFVDEATLRCNPQPELLRLCSVVTLSTSIAARGGGGS